MGALDNDNAYWAAVAQVIPVLALAIVLEARSFARRWTKKHNTPSLRFRRVVAIWLVLLGYGMVTTEVTALGHLRSPGHSSFDLVVAWLSVAGAMITVVTIPVTNFSHAAVADRPPSDRTDRLMRREVRELKHRNLIAKAKTQGARLNALANQAHAINVLSQVRLKKLEGESVGDLEETWTGLLEGIEETLDLAREVLRDASQVDDDIAKFYASFAEGDSPAKRKKRARMARRLLRNV